MHRSNFRQKQLSAAPSDTAHSPVQHLPALSMASAERINSITDAIKALHGSFMVVPGAIAEQVKQELGTGADKAAARLEKIGTSVASGAASAVKEAASSGFKSVLSQAETAEKRVLSQIASVEECVVAKAASVEDCIADVMKAIGALDKNITDGKAKTESITTALKQAASGKGSDKAFDVLATALLNITERLDKTPAPKEAKTVDNTEILNAILKYSSREKKIKRNSDGEIVGWQ